MDNKPQLICFECKNFIRFYVKKRNKFQPIERGYCKECGIKSENRCCKVTECLLWEAIPSPQEERKMLEMELRNICKRLNEIATYIENID